MVLPGPIWTGSRGQERQCPYQASWDPFWLASGKPEKCQIRPPGVYFGGLPGPSRKTAKSSFLGHILSGSQGQAANWLNQACWDPLWRLPKPGRKISQIKAPWDLNYLAGFRGQAGKEPSLASWGALWPNPKAKPKNCEITPPEFYFGPLPRPIDDQ